MKRRELVILAVLWWLVMLSTAAVALKQMRSISSCEVLVSLGLAVYWTMAAIRKGAGNADNRND